MKTALVLALALFALGCAQIATFVPPLLRAGSVECDRIEDERDRESCRLAAEVAAAGIEWSNDQESEALCLAVAQAVQTQGVHECLRVEDARNVASCERGVDVAFVVAAAQCADLGDDPAPLDPAP